MQQATLKDLRIYNGDVAYPPSALAPLLYAETPYGDANIKGLLFRSFNAPIPELTDYTGANLTEAQKLVDDIGFAVGTPKNAPLGVAL